MCSLKVNVSIVIPAFNEERYIGNCLDSISQLNYPKDSLEVIVVDNGSRDQTVNIAKKYDVKVLVKSDGKVGAVRNYGAKNAKGEVLFFLDSDCTLSKDWLMNAIEFYKAEPGSVYGGQYLLRERPSWIEKYWILGDPSKKMNQRTLVGGCIMIPKKIFFDVGLFNEMLNSGEDTDLHNRLEASGYSVYLRPEFNVTHLGFPSTIEEFIKRQVWHSSDYIIRWRKLYKDKVFVLVLMFLAGLFSLVLTAGTSLNVNIVLASSILMLVAPLVLSIKRIRRSQFHSKKAADYFLIFIVDVIYLIGRSIGFLNSIKNAVILNKYKKISRR